MSRAGGEFILMRFQQVKWHHLQYEYVQHGIIMSVDQLLLQNSSEFR